nr:ABC-2 transporter permease [uncultured Cellulosilyticum sp.]
MRMTMKLVKKDFMHLGYSLKSLILSWLVLCTLLPLVNLGVALAMPALGAYLAFYSMMSYEEKNKGSLLTSALPVTREAMCNAQYVEIFIYIIAGIICSSIGLGIKRLIDNVDLSVLASISVMFSFGIIYVSIILPCVFYFGTAKSRYILMITYGVTFGGATAFNMAEKSNLTLYLQRIGSGINGSIILLIALLIGVISYFISLKIFQNKDFK